MHNLDVTFERKRLALFFARVLVEHVEHSITNGAPLFAKHGEKHRHQVLLAHCDDKQITIIDNKQELIAHRLRMCTTDP